MHEFCELLQWSYVGESKALLTRNELVCASAMFGEAILKKKFDQTLNSPSCDTIY